MKYQENTRYYIYHREDDEQNIPYQFMLIIKSAHEIKKGFETIRIHLALIVTIIIDLYWL